MKIQYEIDPNGALTGHTRLVSLDTDSTENWHDGWVSDGFSQHKFINGNWVGSDDDYEKPVPVLTDQEKVNIALTKELADTKLQLETANNGLIALKKEVAEMKGAQA
ncbi:hypothetical protein [Lapidilactobacillus wuchangensis]|uniref:hypothetical protein n=1 Tax=Lapidilactobacillus wuchangensis TaxID=2486001 RepID=UPI000F7A99E6|nr:hypothetical protein [Lapidilactobacillus wuchangensis]